MPENRIKTGIIGIGSWGRNIARELHDISDLSAYVSLETEKNTSWALEHFPTAKPSTLEEVCADATIKAVAIATPTKTHTEIAEQLLKAGKHIFIEKPTAATAEEAQLLTDNAAQGSFVLVTGYIFLYSPAYRELKRQIGNAAIKEVSCVWKKYGTFIEPIETNLLTHHLSIALDLLGEPLRGTILRHASSDETICNNIETTLAYNTSEFHSSIDRLSKETSHIFKVSLADGTSFLWDGPTLSKRESKDAPYVRIYENNEQPLTLELQFFVDAACGKNAYLPSAGDFGMRVLQLLERLTTK